MAAANLAGAKKTGLQDQIDTFDKALPSLVAARNMLEHFEDQDRIEGSVIER